MAEAEVPDFYQLLGVSRAASEGEIRVAYRRLSKVAHPDVGGSDALFRLIRIALDTLTDPVLRQNYDDFLAGRRLGEPPHGGGDVIPCPDLLGMDVRFAEKQLSANGFTVLLVLIQDSTGPDFQVVGQWPTKGSPVPRQGVITLGFGVSRDLRGVLTALLGQLAQQAGKAAATAAARTRDALERAGAAAAEAASLREAERAARLREEQAASERSQQAKDAHRKRWEQRRADFNASEDRRFLENDTWNRRSVVLLVTALALLFLSAFVRFSTVTDPDDVSCEGGCTQHFTLFDGDKSLDGNDVFFFNAFGREEGSSGVSTGLQLMIPLGIVGLLQLAATRGLPWFGNTIRVVTVVVSMGYLAAASAWPSMEDRFHDGVVVQGYLPWPLMGASVALMAAALVSRPKRGVPIDLLISPD